MISDIVMSVRTRTKELRDNRVGKKLELQAKKELGKLRQVAGIAGLTKPIRSNISSIAQLELAKKKLHDIFQLKSLESDHNFSPEPIDAADEKFDAERELLLSFYCGNPQNNEQALDSVRTLNNIGSIDAGTHNEVDLIPPSYSERRLSCINRGVFKDRSTVLKEININWEALQHAPDKYLADEEIILSAVKQDDHALHYASRALCGNISFMLKAVAIRGGSLRYALKSLKNNQTLVMAAIQQNPQALEFSSQELRNNRDVVFNAVIRGGTSIRYASVELKNNRSIAIAACGENGLAIEFLSNELQSDLNLIGIAINRTGMALQHLKNSFRNQKAIVLKAVLSNGLVLEHASSKLRDDEEIVKAAISQCGLSLQFASLRLKEAKHVILSSNDGFALQFASTKLQNDHEVVLNAVEKDGFALQFASNECRDNVDIVLIAALSDYRALFFASDRLKMSPRFRSDAMFILKRNSIQSIEPNISPQLKVPLSFNAENRLLLTNESTTMPNSIESPKCHDDDSIIKDNLKSMHYDYAEEVNSYHDHTSLVKSQKDNRQIVLVQQESTSPVRSISPSIALLRNFSISSDAEHQQNLIAAGQKSSFHLKENYTVGDSKESIDISTDNDISSRGSHDHDKRASSKIGGGGGGGQRFRHSTDNITINPDRVRPVRNFRDQYLPIRYLTSQNTVYKVAHSEIQTSTENVDAFTDNDGESSGDCFDDDANYSDQALKYFSDKYIPSSMDAPIQKQKQTKSLSCSRAPFSNYSHQNVNDLGIWSTSNHLSGEAANLADHKISSKTGPQCEERFVFPWEK